MHAAPAAPDSFPSLQWRWALRDSDLAPRLKDLARLMSDYADDTGTLRPSVGTLRAEHTQDKGVGERLNTPTLHAKKTVERRVEALVKAGWIERASKGGIRGGQPIATVYRLTFPTDSSYGQRLRTVGVASSSKDLRPTAVGGAVGGGANPTGDESTVEDQRPLGPQDDGGANSHLVETEVVGGAVQSDASGDYTAQSLKRLLASWDGTA